MEKIKECQNFKNELAKLNSNVESDELEMYIDANRRIVEKYNKK